MNNLDSDPGAIIPQLLIVAVLTLINAFFASAEMAIVSVNKQKIRRLSEEGNKKAKLLEALIEDPSNFLSTIQVGITLAGFLASAYAATGIADDLSQILPPHAAMIVVTLILSYFTLVFGELVPKRIALKKAEKISLSSVTTVYYISKLTKPFIKLLSFSTTLILKLTGNNDVDLEETVSEEEIKALISQCQEEGCIENEEQLMIYKVFDFNDKTAREIMTSRQNVFAVDVDDNIDEILEKVINSGYSRIPVYKDSIDNIVGILYTKDLLKKAKKYGFDNIILEKILHEPFFAVENIKTNELFKLLKEKKVHVAILFDEYGGVDGLVTMEDLIEEVMGDIEDEHDIYEKSIRKINEEEFIVKGYITISEFEDIFGIRIEEGDYDTLNGYLLTRIGKVPKAGHILKLNHSNLTIVKVNNKMIEDIKVTVRSV